MKSEQIEEIVDIAATLASRADEYDQVLVLYRRKADGFMGSMDNSLEIRDCAWLGETFLFWLRSASAGLLKERE